MNWRRRDEERIEHIRKLEELCGKLQEQNEKLAQERCKIHYVHVPKIEYNPAVDIRSLVSFEGMQQIPSSVCEPLARVFTNSTFKSYMAQKRDMFVNDMVHAEDERANLIARGSVRAIDSLYEDLAKFSEVARIRNGMKEQERGV